MQFYDTLAVITVLAALFSYVNYRFIRLQEVIGVMIISLVTSLAIFGIGIVQPNIFPGGSNFYP